MTSNGETATTKPGFRMLHTMIRVKALDKSIAFHTGPLGMKLLRRRDVPEGKYTLAVAVPDAYKTCEAMRAQGVMITREPGPVKFGTTVIAFVDDPDG